MEKQLLCEFGWKTSIILVKNLDSFKPKAFFGPSTLGFEVKTTFFIQNLGILSKSPKGGQFSDF